MRLDELIRELWMAWSGDEAKSEYPAVVHLNGQDLTIDRVEPFGDGIRLHVESYPDNDLWQAQRDGRIE